MPDYADDLPEYRRLTCSVCGLTKYEDEFFVRSSSPTGRASECRSCAETRRMQQKVPVVNETRQWGVEIEFQTSLSSHIVASRLRGAGLDARVVCWGTEATSWQVKGDGSLNGRGWEIASPPLVGAEGLAQLATVCRVLKRMRARVNRLCGLHIHHDARGLETADWKRLVKLYAAHEAAIDSMMPPSRKNSQWAMRLRAAIDYERQEPVALSDYFADIDRCSDLYELRRLQGGRRYMKLNLEAYTKHGTVEFRQHAGTVEFDKIAQWLSLGQQMVEAATVAGPGPVPARDCPLENLLARVHATPAQRRFFQRRVATFAVAA